MTTKDEKHIPTLKYLTLPKASDYRCLSLCNTGICEVNGNHPIRRQEDAIAIHVGPTSAALLALSPDDQDRIAKDTFANLQRLITDKMHSPSVGSCAVVATAHVQNDEARVSTSYVGDSFACLMIIDQDGKLKSITPCVTELHDGYNEQECRRVKAENGRVVVVNGIPRLNGELSVTRALGDAYFDDKGISHVPQTTLVIKDVTPEDHIFLIVTCDGAMEHHKGSNNIIDFAEELAYFLQKHFQHSPDKIAELIVDNALAKQSLDNITVIVAPLESNKSPITIAVFDGHGGAEVSRFLAENYYAMLGDCLN